MSEIIENDGFLMLEKIEGEEKITCRFFGCTGYRRPYNRPHATITQRRYSLSGVGSKNITA